MQITKEHIEVFSHYEGDGDAFIRLGTKREKEIMNYDSWKCIENLIQDIMLLKNGKVSSEYSKGIKKKMKEICVNQEVIKMLESISDLLLE